MRGLRTCVTRSTGWQPHTVRAFLAAVVRKKLGLRLESEKTDGERVYRIVSSATVSGNGPPAASAGVKQLRRWASVPKPPDA